METELVGRKGERRGGERGVERGVDQHVEGRGVQKRASMGG